MTSSQKAQKLQRALVSRFFAQQSYSVTAAAAPRNTLGDSPVVLPLKELSYASILQSLSDSKKSSVKPLKVNPRPYTKAFNEIKRVQHPDQVKVEASKHIPWSSANDTVLRSPFARDVAHMQSLLDVLLAARNLERAANILDAMLPFVDDRVFIALANQYLEVYAQEESTSVEDIEAFLADLSSKYKLSPNARSYAIAIARAVNDDKDYMKLVRQANADPRMLERVFENIDVLTLEQLSVVFKDSSIEESQIPNDLVELFQSVRRSDGKFEERPDYFVDKSIFPPALGSLIEELRPVDSFGLTVIRHTLQGLETDKPLDLESLFEEENMSGAHLLHCSRENRPNYHEIYRSIKTEEGRAKFNRALDTFNVIRQKELESKGVDAAREKWRHEFEDMQARGGIAVSKSFNAQLYLWYLDILPLVKRELELCQELLASIDILKSPLADKRARAFYAPYLVLVPPEQLTAITLLEILQLASSGGVADGMRTTRAIVSIGRAVEIEHKSKLLSSHEKKSLRMRNSGLWRKYLANKKVPNTCEPIDRTDWELPLCAKLGSVLLNFVLEKATVTVHGTDPTTGESVTAKQPAFHHTFLFAHGQRLGVVRLHKQLLNHLSGKSIANAVQPQLLPMLVAPREWNLRGSGGYRYMRSSLVRVKDSAETLAYVKAAGDAGDLDQVYKGLNVLGNTSWTINARTLAVITHYWNTGKEFLDLPPVFDEAMLPSPVPADADPEERADYVSKVRRSLSEAAGHRSQRCDSNFKLEIARAFVGEKIFFPHNVDFRGRAYPLSPHFNHLGNDMTRSLFLFWEGKRLGKEGLRWLKIHMANMFGMDKVPLDERVAFVDGNLDQIFRAADDPHKEEPWWSKAEKPWQVLSVCFELRDAYKLEDPTQYVSHLPVHQDGTCNGLQHYAALGGDIEGARQVNLLPADRPQDVYKHVAGIVERRLETEAAAGNELAQFMRGKITRKVVKQTVMTNVYGVTFVGAVAQIEKQMEDWFENSDDAMMHHHSRYLTALVFESMRELFEGAHLIQDWLGEAAKRISRCVRTDCDLDEVLNPGQPSHLSSVVWTTPLGMPCVQPYRLSNKLVVTTNIQVVCITDPFEASQVDPRKQATAFPPNFIHSLDATHMLLTAGECGDRGMIFASVHDSYWTHASEVNTMNEIIREQFVNLHKDDLIVKLRDEFERRYKGFLCSMYIDGQHELAVKIRQTRRKIVKKLGRGMTFADEIKLEKKRRELLNSPSAQNNELGRQMETTISVTENYDLEALKVKSTLKNSVQILAPLKFPPIPKRGELDVELVKDSLYFFS